MQAALDEVAAHCSNELDEYQTCVDSKPHSWQLDCAEHKSALTACAALHSGLVNAVKERCKSEIEQYERCLKANAGEADTCMPQLERLWACTEPKPPHACGPDCKHQQQQWQR
jgi:hypothetical protein